MSASILLKKSVVFCSLTAAAMHGVNRLISSGASVKNLLKPEKGSFYHHPVAGNVYYEKYGSEKPSLLLLHDGSLPGSSGFEWKECARLLSSSFTVYILDLPGCGRSDKQHLIYTNYLMVRVLSGFIREVIGEKTRVAASGLSASFILCAAYADPELVSDLIMVNPVSLNALKQTSDLPSRIRFSLLAFPVLGTAVYHILTHRQNLDFQMNEHYFYNPFHVQKRDIDAFYEASHRGSGAGRFYQASLDGHYLNWDCRRILSLYKGSLHILYGDRLEKEEQTIRVYRKYNQGVTSSPVFKTKQLPHMENPQKCAEEILKRFILTVL